MKLFKFGVLGFEVVYQLKTDCGVEFYVVLHYNYRSYCYCEFEVEVIVVLNFR